MFYAWNWIDPAGKCILVSEIQRTVSRPTFASSQVLEREHRSWDTVAASSGTSRRVKSVRDQGRRPRVYCSLGVIIRFAPAQAARTGVTLWGKRDESRINQPLPIALTLGGCWSSRVARAAHKPRHPQVSLARRGQFRDQSTPALSRSSPVLLITNAPTMKIWQQSDT